VLEEIGARLAGEAVLVGWASSCFHQELVPAYILDDCRFLA